MEGQLPERCYTIWFSQRTGSTLLCEALRSTGIAGRISEQLNERDPQATTLEDLRDMVREGTTPNGVFGLKYGPDQRFGPWMQTFRRELALSPEVPRPDVWEAVFPSSRHLYMTRRNKVRLAVSWWRAIVSGEWHRERGQAPQAGDLQGRYSFDAINHLFAECSLREAATEEFFAEGGVLPLTLVYEDFIRDYEGTVRAVLAYLDLPTDVSIAPPAFERLADGLTEEWVQRFREERQAGWSNRVW
ncbi:Stf0 family sulfotransferase [Deinococcus planocerae]|uniref:Stf0 family sulfotransferase n=1 Tax=Deinococcus planocerae TaxID=1737569 RepID=UPI000C7F32D9|nr:Stf0 family sulfotransferase [Deinococcus planocerae]